MPPFVPEPASSEAIVVVGEPTSRLPVRGGRRVVDRGIHFEQVVFKHSEDALDYHIDLRGWLEPGDRVVGASAWTDSTVLVVSRVQYGNTGAVVWLVAGEDNVRATASCIVTTLRGIVKLFRFKVHTRGQFATAYLLPPALSFPKTVEDLSSTPLTIVFTNTSDEPVSIEDVDVPDGFTLAPYSDDEIEPGHSTTLTVTFTPDSVGTFSGNMVVTVDGTDYTVGLSGTAVAEEDDDGGGGDPEPDPPLASAGYDFQMNFLFSPTREEVLPLLLALHTIVVPANFSGSRARVLTPAAYRSQVFDVIHNSASIGTLTFAQGASNGTFSGPSTSREIAPGDRITLSLVGEADGVFHGLMVALRLGLGGD